MAEQGTGKAQVRTASDRRPAARPRANGGPAVPTGGGARLLAPLAVIVCAIAVLSVLSSSGSDNGSAGTESDSTPANVRSTSGGDSSSEADTTSATGPTGKPLRATYRVKPGDTFSGIAENVGVPVDTLAELNPEVDARTLQTGQKLKLK
jgi:LysM repeat protein